MRIRICTCIRGMFHVYPGLDWLVVVPGPLLAIRQTEALPLVTIEIRAPLLLKSC